MQPLVEIILVNFNGYDDTIDCIRSLERISYENFRIVVVNNGSSIRPNSQQLEFLQEHSIYIESKHNKGFAGGNNYGISQTEYLKPDYLLLLNNDTVVTKDFLSFLVSTAESNNDVGLVCGKINWYDEKERIWFGGGTYNPVTCSTRHIRFDEIDTDNSDYIVPIEFATGCMLLIPRSIWEIVGSMEESLFLYAEDTDFSRRIRNKGYKIYYNNKAKIYHKVSRSTGRTSENTQYYIVRNELYIIKHYSTNKLVAYCVKYARFIMDILKKRKRLSAVVAGVKDFYKGEFGQRKG